MKHALIGCLLATLVLAGCYADGGDPQAATSVSKFPTLTGTAADRDVAAAAAAASARHRATFATLPDRGELAAYPASQPATTRTIRRGAYTWHRIAISEAHALNAIAGRPLRITTPSGELLDFRYERHVEHPSGDWTWIGQLEGGAPSDEAIVTFGAQAVFGSLAQRDDAPLRLTMRDGASWLVETDRSLLAKVDNAATRPTKPDYLLPPKPASWAPAATSPDKHRGPASTGNAPGTGFATAGISGSTVDVLLGYTNGFAASVGGQSAAVTRMHNLVDTANVVMQNSQLAMRFRLVHTMQVNYVDNTDNGTALEEMTGFVAPSTETTPNPAFNALRAARDQYGADLVSLVRKFSDPENDGCGIAWLIGGGQEPIVQEYEYFGYSVVSDGQDGSYYCRDETLAHELGHNMGSAHDRETAEGDDGTLDPDEYGRYAYSFGQKTAPGSGDFYTVMAYGDSGQLHYRIYSNPRTTFCGGRSCGIENQTDNARSLSQTMPTIATFRASLQGSNARNDVDADGKSDLVWQQSGKLVHWLMDSSYLRSSSTFNLSSAYHVIGVGDLTGDGRLDLIWTSPANDLYLWRGTNGGYVVERMSLSYPVGWTLASVGDVDGDGKFDLVWHQPGKLVNWLMDGASLRSYSVFNLSSAYRIVGSGDTNGDGRLDLVWTSAANDLYYWYGTGSAFSVVRSNTGYPTGWNLVAVGDVDADGKSDLIWQQPGKLVYWSINAAAITRYASFNVSSAYHVIGSGDFSGDGKLDLVWTSAANDLYMWRGSGSGFAVERLATNYPVGWTLVSK